MYIQNYSSHLNFHSVKLIFFIAQYLELGIGAALALSLMWQHKFKGTLNFRLTADTFLNN